MEEVLRLENVTRIRDETVMLDNINMHIFKGEVLGLVCINFHGQRELIELLVKNLPIHYGRVYYNEILVNSYERPSMGDNKMVVIEKQSRLVEDLSVADNVFVLRKGFRKYVINKRMLRSQIRGFTQELGLYLDGSEQVKSLTAFEKIMVELLRAVIMGIRLIIIDDISDLMSGIELKMFQHLIEYYAAQGFSFFYICSHHEEAFKVCGRVSVMENGQILKVLDKRDFLREKMEPFYLKVTKNLEKVAVESRNRELLRFERVTAGALADLSFRILEGECTVILDKDNQAIGGICGLLSGKLVPEKGNVIYEGRQYELRRKETELGKGICFIDQYPVKSMVFPEMTYLDNLCFLLYEKLGWVEVSHRIKRSIMREYETILGDDIYAKDITGLRKSSLYSMVYYRIYLFHPRMVFIQHPFTDADLYGRLHILHLIKQLKKRGITVVILAVNLADSLLAADRLITIEHGSSSTEYVPEEFFKFRHDAVTPD